MFKYRYVHKRTAMTDWLDFPIEPEDMDEAIEFAHQAQADDIRVEVQETK